MNIYPSLIKKSSMPIVFNSRDTKPAFHHLFCISIQYNTASTTIIPVYTSQKLNSVSWYKITIIGVKISTETKPESNGFNWCL